MLRRSLLPVIILFCAIPSLAQIPSGSIVWLRSDKGVMQVNSHVQEWQDQSGNGNNAVMSDAAFQPLYLNSAVNGQPAIKFNGSAYMQCPSVFPTKHNYTICTVVRFDDGNPNNIVSGEDHALYMYWDRTPRVQNHDVFSMKMSKIPLWESGFSCVVVPYSNFSQQAAIFVNGQEGEHGYVGPNTDSTMYLGSYRKGFFLIGELQEVIIYDRVLTGQEQNDLQSYLMDRYHIATATALPKPDSTFTELPRHLQLYPRNADDSASVPISGNVYRPGFDSIYCIQFKDSIRIGRNASKLTYTEGKAAFAFTGRLHAELSEYRFEVHLVSNTLDTIIAAPDSVTCGEVFLVDGQGNSSPGFMTYRFQSEFCRSIGRKYTPDPGDTSWQISTADGGSVGAWPLRFQEELIERYHLPSCCIDGAIGGTNIEEHEPTDTNHLNLWSAYGKQLYQATKSGICGRVKTIFWDQGEANYAEGYYQKFKHLYDAWKQDYPSLRKIYLMQLRPNGCYFGNIGMRDIQRWMPDSLHDVETIAAAAIPGQDGCHYTDSGYIARCERFFLPYARDFLGATDTSELRSPNPVWAWYRNPQHQNLAVLFRPAGCVLHATNDTVVAGKLQQLKDYLYTDDTFAKVTEVSFDGDTMFITFDRASSANSIGFTPDQFYYHTDSVYEGPWIVNSRGYGALLWHDLEIHTDPMSVFSIPPTSVSIYPNPSTESATIDLTSVEGRIQIKLINDLGQIVREESVNGGTSTKLDYFGLSAGVYRLLVRSASGIETLNVVIR
jgi:hypothetical protein